MSHLEPQVSDIKGKICHETPTAVVHEDALLRVCSAAISSHIENLA